MQVILKKVWGTSLLPQVVFISSIKPISSSICLIISIHFSEPNGCDPSSPYLCNDKKTCISMDRLCDHRQDCPDGEDEAEGPNKCSKCSSALFAKMAAGFKTHISIMG